MVRQPPRVHYRDLGLPEALDKRTVFLADRLLNGGGFLELC